MPMMTPMEFHADTTELVQMLIKGHNNVKLDAEGRLWIAEFGGQRVTVMATDGRCLGVWGAPGRSVPGLNRPWGVALAPQRRFWVLDSGCDRAYLLDRHVVLGRKEG